MTSRHTIDTFGGPIQHSSPDLYLCDACVDHFPSYVTDGAGGQIIKCPIR